jgi:hypothetical protein
MGSLHAATVSTKKNRLFCVTGSVIRRGFHGVCLFKDSLASLGSTTTISIIKSQLNTPGQENPVFAGRQL